MARWSVLGVVVILGLACANAADRPAADTARARRDDGGGVGAARGERGRDPEIQRVGGVDDGVAPGRPRVPLVPDIEDDGAGPVGPEARPTAPLSPGEPTGEPAPGPLHAPPLIQDPDDPGELQDVRGRDPFRPTPPERLAPPWRPVPAPPPPPDDDD